MRKYKKGTTNNLKRTPELIIYYNPPELRLKENGQNPDSGSKNSENQNNDAVS